MRIDGLAWRLGGLTEAGVRFALERVEDAAGLATLATMRRVTDARRLQMARTLLVTLHDATPSIARIAGASTAVAVLAAGRATTFALRAPVRILSALSR